MEVLLKGMSQFWLCPVCAVRGQGMTDVELALLRCLGPCGSLRHQCPDGCREMLSFFLLGVVLFWWCDFSLAMTSAGKSFDNNNVCCVR